MHAPRFASLSLIRLAVLILLSATTWAKSDPVPLLIQPLIPASAAPGSDGFTITINGTGFTSTATVYWNGSIRPTTVISPSQVQAQINASDVATPGVASITVGNLKVGDVFSNVIYFPVRASAAGVGFIPRNVQHVLNPGPVAVGDFNNDGLLDFVVTGGTTAQMFLGKGNGTFQPPIRFSTSIMVATMAVGDFNGDGNLDLAILGNGCCNRPVLRVLLGDGKGGFPNAVRFGYLAGRSRILGAADFDNDGKLDLYVTYGGRGEPRATIFLGDGKGGFTPVFTDFRLNGTTGTPAIADFNGDGNLDLAIPTIGAHNSYVVVALGSGDGRLNPPKNYALRLGGNSLIAADVNGDGKIDLISDGVSVLLGNGDGTFKIGSSTKATTGVSVNVGDFNGDGKLDVAAGTSLLLGNGDGTFQTPLTFAGLAPGFPMSIGGFNGDGNPDMLGINGIGGALTISVQIPAYLTPVNLQLGSVHEGETSQPKTATLTNFGARNLVISSIDIAGKNAADFAQTNNCGSSLPPNGSCTIQVTFSPGRLGSEVAALNVTYKGAAPLSMPLGGTGLEPIRTVTLTPSSLSFGKQQVDTTSQPQTATLTNTGDNPVTITNIGADAPFSQTNNCPTSLAPNSSCKIQVTFTPTVRGPASGALAVTDDATGSPQETSLSGTGIGTDVVLTPPSVNFGSEKVGTSSVPVPVTLANQGEIALTIREIAVNGADSGDFDQTNDCGTTVPPQGHCTITITFTPRAKGARSAEVSITDNDPNSPQTVPLTGKGT